MDSKEQEYFIKIGARAAFFVMDAYLKAKEGMPTEEVLASVKSFIASTLENDKDMKEETNEKVNSDSGMPEDAV